MAEPTLNPVDDIELEVDAAILLCGGDVRAALTAALSAYAPPPTLGTTAMSLRGGFLRTRYARNPSPNSLCRYFGAALSRKGRGRAITTASLVAAPSHRQYDLPEVLVGLHHRERIGDLVEREHLVDRQ
jgi:hypothetical protein